MKTRIVPTLIAKNQAELEKRYKKVGKLSNLLQIDVMDGKFVPTHSMDFDFKLPKKHYEAHLMINNPENFILKHKEIKIFIVHFESCRNPEKLIKSVVNKKKIWFAIKPNTPVSKIKKYLSKIDGVLVLAVNPGYYGAKFIPETLRKVNLLRKLKPSLNIGVDGGMNDKTIPLAKKAGANEFAVGSYLQKTRNVNKAWETLKRL